MKLYLVVATLSLGLVAAAQENPAAKITENHAITEADGTVRAIVMSC
jgi:monoterpene epsilon-lactone hydrolase